MIAHVWKQWKPTNNNKKTVENICDSFVEMSVAFTISLCNRMNLIRLAWSKINFVWQINLLLHLPYKLIYVCVFACVFIPFKRLKCTRGIFGALLLECTEWLGIVMNQVGLLCVHASPSVVECAVNQFHCVYTHTAGNDLHNWINMRLENSFRWLDQTWHYFVLPTSQCVAVCALAFNLFFVYICTCAVNC